MCFSFRESPTSLLATHCAQGLTLSTASHGHSFNGEGTLPSRFLQASIHRSAERDSAGRATLATVAMLHRRLKEAEENAANVSQDSARTAVILRRLKMKNCVCMRVGRWDRWGRGCVRV